ncbi:MAG: UvrD-helicase domain-containing protein [Acutalibacteraceae bacterium]|nr:UvrD-helicase domain-containing protein [Acutalibacteraceae bacterium]
MTDNQFLTLRKDIIRKEFSTMNERQFEAVTTANGPVLVLAGAGSGKTTVLVNRISYLVKYGDAYNSELLPFFSDEQAEHLELYSKGQTDSCPNYLLSVSPVSPWNILAITFTNKAAGELKERIAAKLGEEADGIWAGTFHSICGKILRRYASLIGYDSNFTIYDTDDQKRLIKDILKNQRVDDKAFPVKYIMGEISSSKDKLITPADYKQNAGVDYRKKIVAEVYDEYNRRLNEANAMDFDDMIVNTVKLLLENEDVANYYRNKFRYIMVDEYQDTNYAQYVLVKTLAEGENNICVVGDDDQSIYRFRGATIENILNFEDEYTNARVIRLEQNYRSTSHILDAANAVIKNNKGRKGKTLWTDNGDGAPISVHTAQDQIEEAKYVADCVFEDIRNGGKASSHAILYRMNAQSAALENVFARSGVSYTVVGGTRFFDRKEIKDILAYLQVINNPNDTVRIKRIINEPKRSIGDTTVNNAVAIAETLGISLFEVLCNADNYAVLSRSAAKIKAFTDLINSFITLSEQVSIHELCEEVIAKSGYMNMLILAGPTEQDRIENIKELSSSIVQYEMENEEPTLSGFLEEVALVSDIDSLDSDNDRVVMMTVHSAKGLEFENVYLVGWEEGVFPGNQSIFAGQAEMEEERRLAYVAITRAKKKLHITNAYTRMLYGQTNRNVPSRFLKEIPEELCKISGMAQTKAERFTVEPPVSSSVYGRKSSFTVSAPRSASTSSSQYNVGMTVEHNTFGKGKILRTVSMGSDTLLEIEFENIGLKKLMAGFAKLKII